MARDSRANLDDLHSTEQTAGIMECPLIAGNDDVARFFGDLFDEAANGRAKTDFQPGSRQLVWLACSGQKEEQGGINKALGICGERHRWRARFHTGATLITCPFCTSSGGRTCACNSVGRHPLLEREYAAPRDALEVALSSKDKVTWLCREGHKPWKASPRQRTAQRDKGCPLCARS